MANLILLYQSGKGHQESFRETLEELFPGARRGSLRHALASDPLLFLSIEDGFFIFALVSFVRTLLRRKTIGLLFRPGPAATGKSLRLRIKRSILRLMRPLRYIKVLTIVPWYIEVNFSKISDAWIYDLQMWDLPSSTISDPPCPTGAMASNSYLLKAGGRRIIAAIGRQDRDKGFDLLAEEYLRNAQFSHGWMLLVAGHVAAEFRHLIPRLIQAGAYIVDQFISDDDIFDIYKSSDAIWCFYSDRYDQASGIFGRAIQFGVPPFVRPGSMIDLIATSEGIPTLATLDKFAPKFDAKNLVSKFREYSISELQRAVDN